MTRAQRYWPLLVCGPLLIAHLLVFDFVTDDAFISFVYSRNLARHGQLVFNLGERVEGYTNFLWTVLLGGLMKLGLAPELGSRILGALFAIGTLGVVLRISRKLALPLSWAAPALLAASSAFACWSSGGLETQMFGFFLTLGFALYLERRPGAAVGFALAALVRPEGNFFFALTLLHQLLFQRDWRLMGKMMALYGILYLPYFGWRYAYYGDPLPNTFYVKASGMAGTAARGLGYLGRFFVEGGAWFVLPLLVPASKAARSLWTLAWVVCAGLAVYLVSIGGDFMGLSRFVVPILPLLALVAQAALGRMPGRLRWVAVPIFFASFLAWSGRITVRASTLVRDYPAGSGIDMPAFLERFAHDRAQIGKLLGSYARPDDLMTVGGAGAQVYYAQMRAIDAFGLNDRYIAHEVPASSSRPGHQKWAPESYLLSRNPTLLCHTYKITPMPYVPAPAEAAAWRAKGYRWVSLRVPGLEPPYYNFLLRRDRSFGPIAPDTEP